MENLLDQTISQAEKLLKTEAYQEVITLLNDQFLTQYTNSLLYAQRAKAYIEIGNFESAHIDAQKSVETDLTSASAYMIRGLVWFRQKEYDKAIVDYTEAIRLDPTYTSAYLSRGDALSDKAEHDQAIANYTEAIRLDPTYTSAYLGRGNALLDKVEYDQAIADYNEAIRLDPDSDPAYNNRGNAWRMRKKYDQAIIDYTEAIRLDPTYAPTYSNRGNAWYDKAEYDKAIADYTEAIRLDPTYTSAYLGRGNALLDKAEHDKAIANYTEAIRLDPTYTSAYLGRGNAWHDKAEYDKAIADYTEAIRLDPTYTSAYYNRGISFFIQENYDKSIADYNEILRIDPNFTSAYNRLGFIFSSIGDYESAIYNFNRYVESPNEPAEFRKEVALNEIVELRKKLENLWYDQIDHIINQIKQLLLFNKPCLTHYTSLTGATLMVLENSPLRLSEGSYLNDTSEGRELFNYLSYRVAKAKINEQIEEAFMERPFIGSFVAENKHNDLTLWRMYGKEAQAEAKGCALTLNKDNFISRLKNTINPPATKSEIQSQGDEQFTFYNVAYLSNNEFTIPGKDKHEEKQFNDLLKDLKIKIKSLKAKQKLAINKLLNDIAYLFKSSEYQYENEVRLVVQGIGFKKNIKNNPPKVFIELVDVVPSLTKITLGPKVERASEWAAAFNYHIKGQLPKSKKHVEIVVSRLPFK